MGSARGTQKSLWNDGFHPRWKKPLAERRPERVRWLRVLPSPQGLPDLGPQMLSLPWLLQSSKIIPCIYWHVYFLSTYCTLAL